MAEKELSILVRAKGALQAARDIGKVDGAVGKLGTTASRSFSKGLKGAENAVGHLKNRLKELALPLGAIGITAGLFTITGAFEQGIHKAEDMALAVESLTGVTNLSAHAASQLVAVFGRFGIETDKATTIAAFAEKTIGKLALTTTKNGVKTSKLADLEKRYGIVLRTNKGRAVDFATELNRVADYYNTNHTAGAKAALAAQLFGKGYKALIPVLKLGSRGIAEVERKADELGLTLKSAADVKNVHDFINAQRDASEAVGGLEVQLGLLAMPDLAAGLKGFTTFLETHHEEVKKFFGDALKTAEGFASFVTGEVVPAIAGLAGAASKFWSGIPGPLRDLLLKGFIADRTISFFFGISPIKLVAGALGDIASKFIKGVLGINAGVVNIKAGVVTGAGGLPTPGGAPDVVGDVTKVAGLTGLLATIAPLAVAAVAPLAIFAALEYINGPGGIEKRDYQGRQDTAAARGLNPANVPVNTQPGMQSPIANWALSKRSASDIQEAASQLRNVAHDIGRVLTPKKAKHVIKEGAQRDKETSTAINTLKAKQATDTEHLRGTIGGKLAAAEQATRAVRDKVSSAGASMVTATYGGASEVVGAINGLFLPAPVVTVNISAQTISRTTTVSRRTGKRSGSRDGDGGGGPGQG